MAMTEAQIKQLVTMITTVKPDSLDCGSCSAQIAEFAEQHLLGKSLEQSQQAVQTHLENCHCCELEFKSLLTALEQVEEESS